MAVEPELSIILACYGQPLMMAEQEKFWLSWPEDLRKRMEVIVVDDHGDPAYKPGKEWDTDPPIPLRVFRVRTDIHWNQMGARNLGMKMARAPWCLMLDPDMVLNSENLRRIFAHMPKFRAGHHFKIKLKHVKEPYGSPNLYICCRKDFWAAGGYNENFAGHKGYSDVVLHRTLMEVSKRHFLGDVWIDFYGRKRIADADVQSIDRDLKHNKKLFHKAIAFAGKNSWKLYAAGITRHVRFEYDRVR